MLAKIHLTAIVALLTSVAVHGAACAQSNSDHKSRQSINSLKSKIPANAYGSTNGRPGPASVDPDPRIQFELNRDRGREQSSGGGGGNG
jgi:hypothetical protein